MDMSIERSQSCSKYNKEIRSLWPPSKLGCTMCEYVNVLFSSKKKKKYISNHNFHKMLTRWPVLLLKWSIENYFGIFCFVLFFFSSSLLGCDFRFWFENTNIECCVLGCPQTTDLST